LEEEMFPFFHLPVVFIGESIDSLGFLTGTSPDIKIQHGVLITSLTTFASP
jgi:hypothetical protein